MIYRLLNIVTIFSILFSIQSCSLIRKKEELKLDYLGPAESYQYYSSISQRNQFELATNLEDVLNSESDAVFLNVGPQNRSAYMIMLLEQQKDVLCPLPLAANLEEYANITKFRNNYQKIIGLINPLLFYPSFSELDRIFRQNSVLLEMIRITCHPGNLGNGFIIAGAQQGSPGGSALALIQVLTGLTGLYPETLLTGTDSTGELRLLQLEFDGFDCLIRFDEQTLGWNMELAGIDGSGQEFLARTDHTGMLALQNSAKPVFQADPGVMEKALRDNLDDFVEAVQTRNEPVVNYIDGLSSIVINDAILKSKDSGRRINL